MDSGATSRPGVLSKPPVEQAKLLALFVLIGLLIYFSRPTPAVFAAGAVMVAIGAAIRVWAAGHLTRDQQLTTSGPYEYTRNPFYLGRFLLLLGFAVMSGLQHPVAWVLVIAGLVIFFGYYMPRKEQREGGRLQEMFGPDYMQWKANVPSLFPRLAPYRMHPRPWSKDLFMGGDARFSGNKELWTTIAIALLVLLFYARMAVPR